MKDNISYVTQISREDLKEIAQVVNCNAGNGLKITRNGDSVEFAIDEQALKTMMWAFYHNGGFNMTMQDAINVSLDPAG